MEPDPIGLQGGLNPYVYADNNPVMNTDPDGLIPNAVIGAGWGAGTYTVPIIYRAYQQSNSVQSFTNNFQSNFRVDRFLVSTATGAATAAGAGFLLGKAGVTLNWSKTTFAKYSSPYMVTPVLQNLPRGAQQTLHNVARTYTLPQGLAIKGSSAVASHVVNQQYAQRVPTDMFTWRPAPLKVPELFRGHFGQTDGANQ